jgi:hypothetical protein
MKPKDWNIYTNEQKHAEVEALLSSPRGLALIHMGGKDRTKKQVCEGSHERVDKRTRRTAEHIWHAPPSYAMYCV